MFYNFRVEKNPNPSADDILKLHSEYVEALTKLYDEYNPTYGDPNMKLVIE